MALYQTVPFPIEPPTEADPARAIYEERNRLVAAFARAAVELGRHVYIARTAIEGGAPEWHNCIYIDLPSGQVSWHFHDREKRLFSDFGSPVDDGALMWDGHTTAEKYDRLDRWLRF